MNRQEWATSKSLFPPLEAMGHVKFKLNVPALSWDRAEKVKIAVVVSKRTRVDHGPVHPGGNLPT